MKKKETLDFLKGTAMDGIINNATAATANTNPVKEVEKVEAKIQAPPGPSVRASVKKEVKKSSAKKTAIKPTAIKADNDRRSEISTTVRINKSLLEQAMLIFGKGKKTREITEHVFLEFIKKNRKVLVQNIEEEIENLKSKI